MVMGSEEAETGEVGVADLRKWIPRFYGTLRLEGEQNEEGEMVQVKVEGAEGEGVGKDMWVLSLVFIDIDIENAVLVCWIGWS